MKRIVWSVFIVWAILLLFGILVLGDRGITEDLPQTVNGLYVLWLVLSAMPLWWQVLCGVFGFSLAFYVAKEAEGESGR